MKNAELISKRFSELEEQFKTIPFPRSNSGPIYADQTAWRQWSTSTLNLLSVISGEHSVHYANFKTLYDKSSRYTYRSEAEAMHGVFLGAKSDFEGGYIFKLETLISGEIFSDFVSLAKQAMKEHNKDVAAVLACAALEDALKRYAGANGLSVNDKVMQEVVGALKSKGLISGAQKSLLDTMPKIRDYAMHANWEKISSEDVSSVIGFVEQFLLEHF